LAKISKEELMESANKSPIIIQIIRHFFYINIIYIYTQKRMRTYIYINVIYTKNIH